MVVIFQIKDTLNLLSNHMIRQRVEFGLYGLFSKYKSDVIPITTLVAMISCAYVITASMTAVHNDQDSCKL